MEGDYIIVFRQRHGPGPSDWRIWSDDYGRYADKQVWQNLWEVCSKVEQLVKQHGRDLEFRVFEHWAAVPDEWYPK